MFCKQIASSGIGSRLVCFHEAATGHLPKCCRELGLAFTRTATFKRAGLTLKVAMLSTARSVTKRLCFQSCDGG
jgi:hypothetical protein